MREAKINECKGKQEVRFPSQAVLVGKDAPFSFVEAYKSLRTNLEFLSTTSNCKTILITSSVPEEGKSNVAVNLAMTLAASNKRVVLVDCDMRKSTVSRYMHISRSQAGLSNVISSRDISTLAGALVRMKEYNGIMVLPCRHYAPQSDRAALDAGCGGDLLRLQRTF